MSSSALLTGLDPTKGALLVVDVQRSFGDPDFLAEYGLDDEAHVALAAAIVTIARLVDAARASGVPVIWIELGSTAETPWGSSNWLRGRDPETMPTDEPCIVGTPGAEWFGVTPEPGELRVVKRHYSGFHQTELDAGLKAAGIQWVAVAGLTTECCVAATATDAIQYGYPVIMPADASAAYEVRIHENALEQLALSVAKITSVAEFVDALPAPHSPAPHSPAPHREFPSA
jgi:nicotinamidase-related amidase